MHCLRYIAALLLLRHAGALHRCYVILMMDRVIIYSVFNLGQTILHDRGLRDDESERRSRQAWLAGVLYHAGLFGSPEVHALASNVLNDATACDDQLIRCLSSFP